MKKTLLLVLFSFAFVAIAQNDQTLVFKLKNTGALEKVTALLPYSNKSVGVVKSFPNSSPVTAKAPSQFVDLSTIYQITGTTDYIQEALNQLRHSTALSYVEILPQDEVALAPSDPDINQQYYLNLVDAFQAFDKTQGNANVVIAIIDTGTELDHPDLQGKLAYNTNDTIDGIDNDFDGYIDNYQGWDFANNDNDPTITANEHGLHVTGIAAAATNNNVGMASAGFNTRYLPVKVGNSNSITHGYHGIVYAADQGADIINCSWGGSSYSSFANDVVNYATFNKGALVVGAAGNNNKDQMFYPAAYESVMAVAASDENDLKAAFSNYGYFVDITAPGDKMYSLKRDGNYGLDNGTSMAAPLVSGAAALLKARYPHLTNFQLRERLKATTEDIYNNNPSYENKLGSGRLNMNQSVTGLITQQSIVALKQEVEVDFTLGYVQHLNIGYEYYNVLTDVANATISLKTNSSHVTINQDQFTVENILTLTYFNNYSSPFEILVDSATPLNTATDFWLEIATDTRTQKYYFTLVLNPSYATLNNERVAVTIGSNGTIGYNDPLINNQGIGFIYDGYSSFLFEGSLMIGGVHQNETKVIDNFRSMPSVVDSDFIFVSPARHTTPHFNQYQRVENVLTDGGAGADSIGITVEISAYNYSDLGHTDYVIYEIRATNNSSDTIFSPSIGLAMDWDLVDATQNKGSTDYERYTSLARSDNGNLYTGIQLLTSQEFNNYIINNQINPSQGIDIISDSGYTTDKKYITLTQFEANGGNEFPTGNDIINVASAKLQDWAPHTTKQVAFALLGSKQIWNMHDYADSAYMRYNGFLPTKTMDLHSMPITLFPNPAQDVLTIRSEAFKKVEIYDIMGKLIMTSTEPTLQISNLTQGSYLIQVMDQSGRISVTKLIKK